MLRKLSGFPVEVAPVDMPMTRLAVFFRAKYKLAYADCFVAALARQRQAILVTADSDFARVRQQIGILWLARR